MLRLLIPREHKRSIFDVDLGALADRGITGVLLDLDNTLVEWQSREFDPALKEWIQRARDRGLALCVLSNSLSGRVMSLAEELGVPAVSGAVKPLNRAFMRGMERLGTSPEETAVIGDQLFTDVLGGNRLGLYTILVEPMARREFITTRFFRILEWIAGRRRGRGARE